MIDPALSRVVRSTWHSKVILRARANVVQWEGSPESCGHVCACALVGIVPVASRTRWSTRCTLARDDKLVGGAALPARIEQRGNANAVGFRSPGLVRLCRAV